MPFMLKASGGMEPAPGFVVGGERTVRRRALTGIREKSSLRFDMWEEDCGRFVRASRSESERLER